MKPLINWIVWLMNKALIGQKLSDKELNYSTRKEKNRVLHRYQRNKHSIRNKSTRDKSIYIYSISLMENQSNFMKRGMHYERICKDDLRTVV